ncbi:uncharacterized protein Triagg1_959 [Trichoderma aggressivum f. europaeum]|uniref:Uncharacterized protein n=1 Tax=Trichoderma aggressivum f. europaeum TaxID=173218 RepID=A0AAE1IKE1_9HYPO|nr:hypothetical protein Triagg1_959 [Trichoderma aggressivum f. europaeum]
MFPLRQSGESTETQRADPEVNHPTSKKKEILYKFLLDKVPKLLNDSQRKTSVQDRVVKRTPRDPNKDVEVDKGLEGMLDEVADGLIGDNQSWVVRSALHLVLKHISKIDREIDDEISNEKSMDGPSVSSSVEKSLLELSRDVAELRAKIDNLTAYHKTGKWPDN